MTAGGAGEPWGPAERLAASRYFDHEWYGVVSGARRERAAAARHYVRRSVDPRFSPHPLFDAAHVGRQVAAALAEDEDTSPGTAASRSGNPQADAPPAPHEVFLQLVGGELDPRLSPHPLLDAELYAVETPGALEHIAGVFGHYVDVGAAAGQRPNHWFDPARLGDLVTWLGGRGAEWAERQALRPPMDREPPPDAPQGWAPSPTGAAGGTTWVEEGTPGEGPPEVTVVVVADQVPTSRLLDCLRSVGSQTLRRTELVLVHHEPVSSAVTDLLAASAGTAGHRVLRCRRPGPTGARNLGLAVATGEAVAWLVDGDLWAPGHLRASLEALVADGGPAVHGVVEVHRGDAPLGALGAPTRSTRYTAGRLSAEALRQGATVPLSGVLVRRTDALALEGFDEGLPAAYDQDMLLRLGVDRGLGRVPLVGTRHWSPPPAVGPHRGRTREASLREPSQLGSWEDVVINRRGIDWAALETRSRVPGSVSVVVPTHDDCEMTERAVACVVETTAGTGREVEVVVVDNGTQLGVAASLAALPLRHPDARVRVVPMATNHGFALGNNMGLAAADGEVVVLLNNDTEVVAGWLDPLLEALQDREVLGAQSLLLYPSGSIQSAGVAFPSCGGVPHAFLQGFPVEDAQRALPGARFAALTAAAVAVRASDLVRVRGLDPRFRNGMEDVDLGLRMKRDLGGHFVVRPDSLVVHHESRATGRFVRSLQNRRLYLERWDADAPRDDVALWARAGYEVDGHAVVRRMPADPRASLPEPLVRRRLQVHEASPRLRWALKNPAPATAEAEVWGDTHFARALAAALRRQGQDVVIDHRPEFNRATGGHDDVALVLRGVAPDFLPIPGQVSIAWLISHPDMFGRSEAESYDVVLAASTTWARETSRAWGLAVEPMLQACDPSSFHPDVAEADTGHPVLFVGNSRRKLRPLVGMAVDGNLPLSVYGPGWEGLIPERFVKGQHVPNARLAAAYRSAGVVLNDHWEDMRAAGFISNRLFDAVAAGARVITDDVADLPEDFGRSVQVAADVDDLRRLSDADPDEVFGDDDERRGVARRTAERHSFDARAARLVELAVPRWRDLHGARTTPVSGDHRRGDTT